MQKIKNSIINRMIEKKCTSKEIDFLFYISRFQDSMGKVTGVHYKDVCDAIKVSVQGYYDTKISLEQKGFIQCVKQNPMDTDITIVGNAYTGEDYNREGYIKTNHSIFSCKEFHDLKAGAKLLALKFMMISFSGKGYFEIGVKKFYDKKEGYQNRFGVTKRVMRTYLMSLKQLFSIAIKSGKYYIYPKSVIQKEKGETKENQRFREKGTEVVLRRNRIKESASGEKEIYGLFEQYHAVAEKKMSSLVELIDRAVRKSLEIINEGEAWIKYKFINIKLVHKLLREELYHGSKNSGSCSVKNRSKSDRERGSEHKKGKNRFLNFHQREYDYDELEKLLLNAQP